MRIVVRSPRFRLCCLLIAGTLGFALKNECSFAAEDIPDVAEKLKIILQVGPNGVGSAAAKMARDELAQRGIEILPQLLVAMDTPNVIAANWLRTVFDPLVDRELAHPDAKWPREFLEEYVSNAERRGRPRELVLNILDKLEPKFRAEWMPTRFDDPDFRYQALALVLAAADKALADKRTDDAKAAYRKAFTHARDSAQVTHAANQLTKLGEAANVAEHLGLITDWWLLGPFNAPAKTGFATVFPPEKQVDLQAMYPGQAGTDIRWVRHQTKDTLGQVNLIDAIAACREAVGYAYAEIDVKEAQDVQLRCSADDNCSVWINGEKAFGRDQWLNGTRFDRFIAPAKLAAGRNKILVKICQGPQHRDPEVPNNWTFQLRFCDANGLGVKFEIKE